MTNPFDSIDVRLSNIETSLLDIKNNLQPTFGKPAPERKTLYSIRAAADFVGCSSVSMQKYKNEGRLPFRQIGRKVMIDTVDLLNAMDQSKKKSRR